MLWGERTLWDLCIYVLARGQDGESLDGFPSSLELLFLKRESCFLPTVSSINVIVALGILGAAFFNNINTKRFVCVGAKAESALV